MKSPLSDPWALDPETFPETAGFDEQAAFLISFATLAPSGHNTQPWLFSVGDNSIRILADRRRALPVVDPHDRELVISCGAALKMLELAAVRFGFSATVTLTPDAENPDVLARVDLGKGDAPDKNALRHFNAIKNRRTSRAVYGSDAPDDDLITSCTALADNHDIGFTVFSELSKRREIAELVARGDLIQFDNPSFRRELASWIHSSRLGGRDGMSGASFGMPDIMSSVGRFAIRTFDLGNGIAAADEKKIISGTPALGVVWSAKDDPDTWMNTGRALASILLELTANGFTSSYLNQPIEEDQLRQQLSDITQIKGVPQILLRIGKTDTTYAPTVRRDVSDVLIKE